PGCRSRRRCDAHHIRPWSQGGATDLDNLILLCRRHHTVVHKHQLRIERTGAAFAGAMQGPAAFAFSLPDGSQLLPLESRARGRAMFDTAVQVARIEAATADADPGTVGGGYGFDRDFCIAWVFEAESRHARERNAVVWILAIYNTRSIIGVMSAALVVEQLSRGMGSSTSTALIDWGWSPPLGTDGVSI